MVHIIHATFCTCALIRKNEPWRGCSDKETFTDNEGTGKRRKKDKKRFMQFKLMVNLLYSGALVGYLLSFYSEEY